MTRDHYKGTPKKIKVTKGADGKLQTLGKLSKTDGEFLVADGYITKRQDYQLRKVMYANASGHDTLGDGSKNNPYRTFRKCMDMLPSVLYDTIWYIDITGLGVETSEEIVKFPPVSSSMVMEHNFSPPLDSSKYHVFESSVNVYAQPTVLDTLTSPVVTYLETTAMAVVTDSTKNWTPGEHRGKALSGNIGIGGAIYDNDATSLYVCIGGTLTGTLEIIEPSATLKYGKSSGLTSFVISGADASLTFVGIRFDNHDSNSGVGVHLRSTNQIYMDFCWLDAGIVTSVAGFLQLSYSNVSNSWTQNGAGADVGHCFFDNVNFSVHGSGGAGKDHWRRVRFEGLNNPLGHGGNAEPDGSFTYDRCSISGSSSAAFRYRGGAMCTITNTEVIDCAGDGVIAECPGRLRVQTVSGTGNGGYGINVLNGAQVEVATGTIVTGASGDFKVGVLPVNSWTSFNSGFTNELDTTATSGTLARLFNPSSY